MFLKINNIDRMVYWQGASLIGPPKLMLGWLLAFPVHQVSLEVEDSVRSIPSSSSRKIKLQTFVR